MRRWVLVFVVGCGGDDAATTGDAAVADAAAPSAFCHIDNVIDRSIGSVQAMDCVHLTILQDDAALIAANDCVLAAAAAQRPYVARWQIRGVDSALASAYVGLDAGSGWSNSGCSMTATRPAVVAARTRSRRSVAAPA